MLMQKTNDQLLVTLNCSDLQQIIQNAVKAELENFKNLIQLQNKKTDHESDVLSREETAKLLGVSTTTLFLWNRNLILKAKKIGRRVYYLKSEVLEILKPVSIN